MICLTVVGWCDRMEVAFGALIEFFEEKMENNLKLIRQYTNMQKMSWSYKQERLQLFTDSNYLLSRLI